MGNISEGQDEFNAPNEDVLGLQTGQMFLSQCDHEGGKYPAAWPVGLSATMLVQLARRIVGKQWTFHNPYLLIGTRLGLKACGAAISCLESSMPTPERIVADVYWAAKEQLDAAGVDFEELVAYHNADDHLSEEPEEDDF